MIKIVNVDVQEAIKKQKGELIARGFNVLQRLDLFNTQRRIEEKIAQKISETLHNEGVRAKVSVELDP